jgi:hypothetical protein
MSFLAKCNDICLEGGKENEDADSHLGAVGLPGIAGGIGYGSGVHMDR